jgi:hypothetical protein
MIGFENNLAVFTEVGLEDMLDDCWVGGEELTMPRIHQPAGAMRLRILHVLVEDPIEVLELLEHGPNERRSVLSSLGKLFDAEDSKGRDHAQDVEGDHHLGPKAGTALRYRVVISFGPE